MSHVSMVLAVVRRNSDSCITNDVRLGWYLHLSGRPCLLTRMAAHWLVTWLMSSSGPLRSRTPTFSCAMPTPTPPAAPPSMPPTRVCHTLIMGSMGISDELGSIGFVDHGIDDISAAFPSSPLVSPECPSLFHSPSSERSRQHQSETRGYRSHHHHSDQLSFLLAEGLETDFVLHHGRAAQPSR